MEVNHKVEAIKLRCGDGQLNDEDYRLAAAGVKAYDWGATPPGGAWVLAKDAPEERREVFLDDLRTYSSLHGTNKVICSLHEYCGQLKRFYKFDPDTEEGKKKEQEVILRVVTEAYQFLLANDFDPTILVFRFVGVDPVTRKRNFKAEDITEEIRRIAEVGES